jgi:hypothetical protein
MLVIRTLNDQFRFPVNLWLSSDVLWRLCPKSLFVAYRETFNFIARLESVRGTSRAVCSPSRGQPAKIDSLLRFRPSTRPNYVNLFYLKILNFRRARYTYIQSPIIIVIFSV